MMEFAYTLKTPVSYQSKGENKKGEVIILSAPSNKQGRHAAKLKQFFFQALASLPETDEAAVAKAAAQTEKEDEKTKGSDIVSLMCMSGIDMYEVHEAFKYLMLGGCASIDGEEKVTSNIYDEIQFSETEEMLGDYLVNFLIPSF